MHIPICFNQTFNIQIARSFAGLVFVKSVNNVGIKLDQIRQSNLQAVVCWFNLFYQDYWYLVEFCDRVFINLNFSHFINFVPFSSSFSILFPKKTNMFLFQWFDNFMSDNFTYFGPVNHRTHGSHKVTSGNIGWNFKALFLTGFVQVSLKIVFILGFCLVHIIINLYEMYCICMYWWRIFVDDDGYFCLYVSLSLAIAFANYFSPWC